MLYACSTERLEDLIPIIDISVIKYKRIQGDRQDIFEAFQATSAGKILFQYDPALELCEDGEQSAAYRVYFEKYVNETPPIRSFTTKIL